MFLKGVPGKLNQLYNLFVTSSVACYLNTPGGNALKLGISSLGVNHFALDSVFTWAIGLKLKGESMVNKVIAQYIFLSSA